MTSFLLVGQSGEARENRSAAVQALLVTVFGGLVMLLGFVLLGEAAGTYRISEIVALGQAGGLGGGTVTAALALILVGALTKSAQLPFHPWLPAAMAAPTPVSAYLHAASMVKAGVYLVARLVARASRTGRVWWVPVVVLGLATMVVGGWRALAAARPQAAARLRHRQPARVPHGAVRRRHADRGASPGSRCCSRTACSRRRCSSSPASSTTPPAPATCAGSPGCGRRCAAARSPPLRRPRRWPGCRRCSGFVGKEAGFEAFVAEDDLRGWLVTLGAGRGLGVHRRLQRPVPVGRVRPQARRGRHPGAPAGAAADRGRPGSARSPGSCSASRTPSSTPTPRATPAPTRPRRPGRPTTTWRCGTASACRCWSSAVALVLGYALHRGWGRVGRLAGHLPRALSAQRGYELAVGGTERVATAVTGRLQVGSVPDLPRRHPRRRRRPARHGRR